MRQVKIKKISLVNFKGIRSFEVDFKDAVTSIYGKNATGKTTIFDAFTWLLFGKNSDDKKVFNIKTLDADGKVIEKLPHEVTAILDVDGEEIRLTKRLKEKWQKRRGSADEEFKGNEEERLYNDVPMSVKDWNEKINAICTEESFKMITNPLYFTAMKWDKQREMLMQMAGDVTIDEIVAVNPVEFGKLIDAMSGKTFDEFKREIGAKKKRIKEEVETLPSRIDERRRDSGNVYDWSLLEARLHHKETKIKEVEEQLSSNVEIIRNFSGDDAKYAEERAHLMTEIALCKKRIEQEIRTADDAYKNRYKQACKAIKDAQETIEYNNKQIAATHVLLANKRKERERLIADWKEIKSRTLQFSEDSFVCPTCGRPLDIDQIEEKQAKMTENFNARKAAELEWNKQNGLKVKADIELLESRLKGWQNDNEQLQATIQRTKAEMPAEPQLITDKDIEKMIVKDEQYLRLCARLSKLDKNAQETSQSIDSEIKEKVEQLKKERDTISFEIGEIKAQLAIKKVSEANEKRIAELESQLRNASEELAQLEGIEFKVQLFAKTRIEMLESRINSLFTFVRFKMFDTQINGGEVETCKAIVNGVPFDDLNNAMKINAGLDIINAICDKLNLRAPIFCDNAESVNELTQTESQIVRLVVSDDITLKIA